MLGIKKKLKINNRQEIYKIINSKIYLNIEETVNFKVNNIYKIISKKVLIAKILTIHLKYTMIQD